MNNKRNIKLGLRRISSEIFRPRSTLSTSASFLILSADNTDLRLNNSDILLHLIQQFLIKKLESFLLTNMS